MSFERIIHDANGKPCIRDSGIPVGRILGAMAGGTTRRELLAKMPALESADIDEAFAFIKQQVKARELPEMEYRGQDLSIAERSDFRAPDPVSERLESLIRRQKTNRISGEEKLEVEDYLRLDHVLAMMKAVAKLQLVSAVG